MDKFTGASDKLPDDAVAQLFQALDVASIITLSQFKVRWLEDAGKEHVRCCIVLLVI